jgi:inhibitor of KinA
MAVTLSPPRLLPSGDAAITVEFSRDIDDAANQRVLALDRALSDAPLSGVTETVPTYRSLMIHFDPRRLTTEALADALAGLDYASAPPRTRRQLWHIPACYDPPHGGDIAEIAELFGLSPARIIGLHHGARYRVYMYGFAPGFTFLGGLPEELKIPRRVVPRPPAPSGSLLIAGGQALIASCAMPTGWYGIGRTPVKMFDPRRGRIFLAGIGDELCFERIDPAAFDAMSTAAEAGEFCASPEYLDEI